MPEIIQSKVGFREKFFRSVPFNYSEIESLFLKVIRYSENTGYPFAAISLDSVRIEEELFYGTINYNAGPLITFDTLKIEGSTSVKPVFLATYLQIKPGTAYSQKKVDRIEDKVRSVPYLELVSPLNTTFQNSESTQYLQLRNKRVNQIDGILGFLPNEKEGNKLLVTGEFNLNLANLFQSGKSFRAEWRSLKPESQYLDLRYEHPFLFRSPIGVNVWFNLLKEDSSFVNRNLRLEMDYIPGPFSKFRFFTDFKNSGLLSSDLLSDPVNMPELADFELTVYGLGFSMNSTNDLIFPRKGWKIELEASLGNKKILRNSDIDESFYENIDLSSIQYYFTSKVDKYFTLGKRSVLKTALSLGKVQNDRLFINDLFRLGGLTSLRGFNERSFFASDYAILTNEWRFLLDEKSYFLLFYDQGYLAYDLEEESLEDAPAGIGAGISISTEAGIFNMVYALGRTNDQSFQFNLSKIHFGYISRF